MGYARFRFLATLFMGLRPFQVSMASPFNFVEGFVVLCLRRLMASRVHSIAAILRIEFSLLIKLLLFFMVIIS